MSIARPDSGLPSAPAGRRTLRVYFIKPSQYDVDGYVLQYRWGVIPNNTLAVLAGLVESYAQQRPDIDVQTVLWDELVDGIVSAAVVASIRARSAAENVDVLIGLAGVQTGQYPRARDLALQCVAAGLPVVVGGFHVSSDEPSRRFLESVGIGVVVGEAEQTLTHVLDDCLSGRLRRRYTVRDGIRTKTGLADITVPLIREAPLPRIDARYMSRFFNATMATIDTSRGCPFVCSYCAVKNVMGRTMRARDPQRVIEWVGHAHDVHGVRSLFIVDDDFFRSPEWERLLLGLAALRRGGRDVTFMMQVDVDAADYQGATGRDDTPRQTRRRRFVELAAAAGCYAVFIGFESFNPRNLERTRKVQNEDRGGSDPQDATARVKAKYRRTVDNWHDAGVAVHAGYMVGLEFDGTGAGRQAARDLTDIGVDIASFFPYTPLPGTEDYDDAWARGDIIDHDFNHWDALHVINAHPTLTPAEVYREYCDAHRAFYSWRRLAWSATTYHRVAGLSANARFGMLTQQFYFTYAYRRGWHPMMGGVWRLRDRRVRRAVIWDEDARALYLGETLGAAGIHPSERPVNRPTPRSHPSALRPVPLRHAPPTAPTP